MHRFSRHRLSCTVGALVASLALATLATSAFASGRVDLGGLPSAERHDRFIVHFHDGSPERGSAAALQDTLDDAAGIVGGTPFGLAPVRRMTSGADVVRADRTLDHAETEDLMRALAERDSVDYVEIDKRNHLMSTPSDPLVANQWHHFGPFGIRTNEAWNLADGRGVVVAVLDTGVLPHVDLDANVLPGYDFITDFDMAYDGNGSDAYPYDAGDAVDDNQCGYTHPGQHSSWHGTHVAGAIAAVANNGEGVAGIAHGANIVPVRVLGKCGGFDSDIADAIAWASGGEVVDAPANAHPAEVLNLSFSAEGTCSTTTQRAIDGAVARGTTVVVAAGNHGIAAASASPASCRDVITVAAIDDAGARELRSNHGDAIDVAAPGYDILSTFNDGVVFAGSDTYDVTYDNGTSVAAAQVSGVVALMQSATHVPKTPQQIEALLKASVRPFPEATDEPIGPGIVDAGAAVASALPTVTEAQPFKSRNFAQDVAHGTVYYLIPAGQPGVTGPTQRIWSGHSGFTGIAVTAKDAYTGAEAVIHLRGTRSNGCNGPKRMEDGVICYDKKEGPLTVSYHTADNPGLAPGRYRATFDVEAVGWHTSYRNRFPMAIDIQP